MAIDSGQEKPSKEEMYVATMRPRLKITVAKLRETRTAKLGVTSDHVLHVFSEPRHYEYLMGYVRGTGDDVGVLFTGNMFCPDDPKTKLPHEREVCIEFTPTGAEYPAFREDFPTYHQVFKKVAGEYLKKLVDPDGLLKFTIRTYTGQVVVDPRTGERH